MIESKTLGSAAGVQYQGVIDKSESTSLPALANGVIIGRFKRGRMDKPFKVTANNYQALLGRDPSNPSYLAIEDVFSRGVSEVSVMRVSSSLEESEDTDSISCIPMSLSVIKYDAVNNPYPDLSAGSYARYRVNDGAWIDYTSDGTGHFDKFWEDALSVFLTSIKGDFEYRAESLPKNESVAHRSTGGTVVTAVNADLIDDNSFIGYPAPFSFTDGKQIKAVIGEVGASFEHNYATQVVNHATQTKIEFVTTTGIGVDLVQAAFGGNATVMSCGVTEWAGA